MFVTASEVETQGLTTLEAAATGLPVVAARAGATPEMVEDGISGYLVAPGNSDGMADRLVWLLQNPAQAKAMGKRGREAAEKHSLDRSIGAHERLYSSLAVQ